MNAILNPDQQGSLTRFNRFMDSLFSSTESWLPPVDVKKTESEIIFEMELPGLGPDDVTVELVGRNLNIYGARKFEKEDKKDNYVRVERSAGSFKRTFLIDEDIEPENVKAKFDNGVLFVTLPLSEIEPVRSINVEVK
jgi:HSP20 family protein